MPPAPAPPLSMLNHRIRIVQTHAYTLGAISASDTSQGVWISLAGMLASSGTKRFT